MTLGGLSRRRDGLASGRSGLALSWSPLATNEPSLLGEDAGFKVVGADPELVSPAKHGVEVAGVGGDGPSGLVEREARVFA